MAEKHTDLHFNTQKQETYQRLLQRLEFQMMMAYKRTVAVEAIRIT